jgi:hypothetical protein
LSWKIASARALPDDHIAIVPIAISKIIAANISQLNFLSLLKVSAVALPIIEIIPIQPPMQI